MSLDRIRLAINGRCNERVIYFGSCGTMSVHGKRLKSFCKSTEALAVCGFKEEIDWLQGAAFELLILGTLQSVPFTKEGMEEFDQRLKAQSPGLYRNLGFRLETA